MVLTIQFQNAEELKWMKPLLELLKTANLKVGIVSNSEENSLEQASKSTLPTSISEKLSMVESLHGSLKLPAEFDYKDFMSNMLSDKYLGNG